MNSGNEQGARQASGNEDARKILRWAPILIVAHAAGASAAITIIAVAIQVPLSRIGVPCALVAACGFLVPALILWLRTPNMTRQQLALRSAVSSFVYLEQMAIALGVSAAWVGIASIRVLAIVYVPVVDACIILLAAWVYFAVNRGGGPLHGSRV